MKIRYKINKISSTNLYFRVRYIYFKYDFKSLFLSKLIGWRVHHKFSNICRKNSFKMSQSKLDACCLITWKQELLSDRTQMSDYRSAWICNTACNRDRDIEAGSDPITYPVLYKRYENCNWFVLSFCIMIDW